MREIRVRWPLIQRSPAHPLFDAREDTVEFVETVVVDDELALAVAAVLCAAPFSDNNARAWPISNSRRSSMRLSSSLSSSRRSRFETAARERPTASAAS